MGQQGTGKIPLAKESTVLSYGIFGYKREVQLIREPTPLVKAGLAGKSGAMDRIGEKADCGMQKKPTVGPQPMQFIVLGGEMASPAFLGLLIDSYFLTIPLWTIVGALMGFASVGFHLAKMLGVSTKSPTKSTKSTPPFGKNP